MNPTINASFTSIYDGNQTTSGPYFRDVYPGKNIEVYDTKYDCSTVNQCGDRDPGSPCFASFRADENGHRQDGKVISK